MMNYPAVFEPCRKPGCGAMAWVRVADVDRIAVRQPSVVQVDDDVIERWNCPCGNYLTWGHRKGTEWMTDTTTGTT